MIFKYSQFVNEIKKSKLEFFKNKEISDKFTSSIEIELDLKKITLVLLGNKSKKFIFRN